MTDKELHDLRREKWRVNSQPIRTLDDAHAFIESVGFCLLYPQRPPVLVPTFLGAYVGDDKDLPTWQHAFADARAKDATELMVRALRHKFAYEVNLLGENTFLVAASVFPYFYGLVGDRNPRAVPKSGPRSQYSPLAAHTFQAVQKEGPITKNKLREVLGGELSEAALDRALGELWSNLRITRVDYNADEGAFWDVMFRWSPEPVREGVNISLAEALTALISKYLDCVVAAEQSEVEDFFSNFVARSRAREAINALLAARELQFIHVAGRAMLQVTPPKGAAPAPRPTFVKPRAVQRMGERASIPRPGRPIARRPRTAPSNGAKPPAQVTSTTPTDPPKKSEE